MNSQEKTFETIAKLKDIELELLRLRNALDMANESGLVYYGMGKDRARFIHHLEAFAALVAAQERDFIATKWENLYGYDKQGVAEFIRKRANTQEEQHEPT